MAIRLTDHYRRKFGCKVYKLGIDAGFTCPNRDGTLGVGGCVFCGADGGSAFAAREGSIAIQIERAKEKVAFKGGERFIAYFQSFTNTYAPVPVLEKYYREAMAADGIVGLAIGTRPDCLSEDVVDLLVRLNAEKPVSVELGLQTVHPESIRYIRRGYENEVYFDAVRRLKNAGIEVVTHIILGLPGETPDRMVETTKAAVVAGTDGVKFHLLYVLRGTDLAKDYLAGAFRCLELAEYAEILDRCLAVLPADTVVHRITGDGAKKDLIAPLWSADKKRVLQYLNTHLRSYLTKEQVQKAIDALPENYKTGDVDRLIRQYVKQKADVSPLRPYILAEQQLHRIYYYVSLKQIKSVEQRMAFIHDNLLFSDWWHTDQLISFVSDLDFDVALQYAKGYLHSEDPFIRRWGYVLFISRLCKGHAKALLPLMHDDGHYYVQMAQAWLIAELAVHEPEAVYAWFRQNGLKYSINGKAIQKICDSFRIADAWKQKYKALRPALK